jgi:hypothetical protein
MGRYWATHLPRGRRRAHLSSLDRPLSKTKSWFNHRKSKPGGRKSSPLAEINAVSWPANWTAEFIDVLTVLTRLVALEPTQGEILDALMRGPLLSMQTLAAEGVKWPTAAADRRPRFLSVRRLLTIKILG